MQSAPTPTKPFHLLLAAVAITAAATGIQLLAVHQSGYGIGAVAVALTITNFVTTDIRAQGARGDVRELAARVEDLHTIVSDLRVRAQRHTLSDTETHRLQHEASQLLGDVVGLLDGPTGPQPIRPHMRRVQ